MHPLDISRPRSSFCFIDSQAMQDLKQRIANYEEIYETVQARKLIAGT